MVVVGSRNSVLVGRGGDEGGVGGSGHDRGREEGDGNGLIGEEYASLGGRCQRGGESSWMMGGGCRGEVSEREADGRVERWKTG